MGDFLKNDILAIGSDHGGYDLKNEIIKYLEENGIKYKDVGSFSAESIDYPEIALRVTELINSGECKLGVLCCGTGIGMSLAANKVKGIRAAACSETYSAKFTRLHNDSNILCLGGRVVGAGTACEMIDLFLNTAFEGGRHQRRVDKIMAIEQK